ncbi:MAG: alpha/beta fold hydrolase [Chitinophagaceae bacterium]
MKNKYVKRLGWGTTIFVLVWLLMAQGCMKFRISDSEAKKEFDKEGVLLYTETVKVGDHHIHYARSGSDSLPTIVFVHGSPGSWSAFSQYMKDKELLSKYRMISVDRPGFGNSDFGRSEHLQKQSQLISPLFSEWNNGKSVFLVGHSLGGPLIIQMNNDNPDSVNGLVLLSASLDPAEEKKEWWRYMLSGNLMQYLLPGAFRPSNKELIFFKNDITHLQHEFANVKTKVFIIHGMKDSFVPVGNAEYAIKQLVNASSVETILIPGANHFIPWTNYDIIKEVLMKLY